jgi:sulfur carrier protein
MMSPTIRLNGKQELLSVRTVAELVAKKSETQGRGVAVALNGAVVRRAEWAGTPLTAGDVVEIVRAMQGG